MNIFLIPPHDLISNHNPSGLYQLARYWQHRHKIYLLRYPYYPTSINIKRSLTHIPVIPIVKPTDNPGTYYIVNSKAIYDAIEKTMMREPIDVVIHANILPSSIAVYLAKKNGVRTIFNYRDHFPESASLYYKNPLPKTIAFKLTEYLTRYNAENSNEVITVSYTLRHLLRKYTSKRIHVVPNGVDAELFKALPKDRSRRELSLEEHDPILLYHGSITEWIDYRTILHAVAKLKQRYPRILLLLVGKIYKTYEEAEIRETIGMLGIEENVIIQPPQPQEKMPTYISASDIVLVPHKKTHLTYTTPLKIPEALACERPTIATNIFEFRIWYRDFVEYYESEEELIGKIVEIQENYEYYSDKARKARTYVTENFDWRIIARNYEEFFH